MKGTFKQRFYSEESLLAPSFWTCDLPTQIFFWFVGLPSLQDLAIFMAPHSLAPFKWPVLWRTTLQQSPARCREHSQDFPWVCMPWQSLLPICLAYMLPQRSPALGFFQQHLEFPSRLPSKYYPGPMHHNFSLQIGTGVSNMLLSAVRLVSLLTVTGV